MMTVEIILKSHDGMILAYETGDAMKPLSWQAPSGADDFVDAQTEQRLVGLQYKPQLSRTITEIDDCTCQVGRHGARWCKHSIAMELLRRAQARSEILPV